MRVMDFCRCFAVAGILLLGIAGCSNSDDSDDNEPVAVDPGTPPADTGTPPNSDAFQAVNAEAQATFDALGINGMGLTIYDAAGNKVFESMYGSFAPDQRVFIASASKLVTGVTLFSLINKGVVSLDSTTAQLLGWTDEKGTITLRHLLSLKSGLSAQHLCTLITQITLEICTDEIYDLPASTPGLRFDYGSTHFTVAGRMAEVATGKPWNTIFTEEVTAPLGLPADIQYHTTPDDTEPTANPLLAGGLVMSMNEYASVLQLVYNKGAWQGVQLIDPQLFDLQAIDPYPAADISGLGPDSAIAHYGLAAWLECDTPETGCAVISSPGLYGFTPWIDRANGYYAIIGMDNRNILQSSAGQPLEQRLKPLIVEALQKL